MDRHHADSIPAPTRYPPRQEPRDADRDERIARVLTAGPAEPPVPDPIMPAIERHLAARSACLGLDDGVDRAGYEAAHDRRLAALLAVENTQPTTVAGLFALARHMEGFLKEDARSETYIEPTAEGHAFNGLINACLGLHAARDPGMDLDWAALAADHPGFLPSPQHQPVGLLRLHLAIPHEARRLLDLADAEIERRRLAFVGHPDPDLWPRVEQRLRREMRMEALAAVCGEGGFPVGHAPLGAAADAAALITAITAGWIEHEAADPDHDAARYERACERRSALLGAAERLPATPDSIQAKALGLAWITYHDLWERGRARGDYARDGRLALDIHAAIVGAAPTEHPDAALLAWEPRIADMTAHRDRLYPARRDTELAALAAVGPSPAAHTPECRAWFERLKAEEASNGHDAAQAAHDAADSALLEILIDLAGVRAGTLDGLIFKARLARTHEVREIAEGIVADLLAMGGAHRTPQPDAQGAEDAATIENTAGIEFGAHVFNAPLRDPRAWSEAFADYAIGMHIADKTLRMTKPEMVAFITDAGKKDDELPSILLKALDAAQETFEGWGKLLSTASARYFVAASAAAKADA